MTSASDRSRLEWIRDAAWLTRGRLSIYPKIFVAAYVLSFAVFVAGLHGTVDSVGVPIGADFVTSWAASSLALEGRPQSAYQLASIHAAENAALGRKDVKPFGWFYPPTFLLIVLPLALLPYFSALAAWTLATLAAYLSVLRKVAPAKETVWLAFAFPATWINLINGQNGFLSAALLGGGLAFLEEQPIFAGFLFGLLAFKPHLAILLPLALVLARKWRCMFAAAATSLAFVAISVIVFGPATWQAFLHSSWMPRRFVLETGAIPYYAQQSVFAAMRLWGAPLQIAYVVQGLAAIACIIIAARLWIGNCPYRLKAAALVICGLLTTPYLFDYDLVVLGIAIAWIALEGIERGFLPFEKSILVLAWIAPIAERAVAQHAFLALSPILNAALLILIAIRAWGSAARETAQAVSTPESSATVSTTASAPVSSARLP